MKIFVTGASGVVGRRVVPLLVQGGHAVTAVGRSQHKRTALERTGARVVDVNLFDASALRDAVQGQDVVVNLATHMPATTLRMVLPGAWRENDRIRREGSQNLVDAALAGGVGRFVQESFAPVYPDRGTDWITEDVPLEPVRYNRTVLDAERSAERFAASGRVGVVLRFAAFYGPDSRFLRELVGLVERGFAPMPGPESALVSSVSHDDAATAVVAALGVPSGTYNVTDDEPVTHREYFDALATTLGVAAPKLPPSWLAPLFGSPGRMLARSLRMSNRKLRAASDWTPKYPSVREGFRAVVAAMPRGAPDFRAQAGFRH